MSNDSFSSKFYCQIKIFNLIILFKRFPESGITVISAFPHTHLQGKTVWTKIIRNKRATQYLFNAESFNFNYQFENLLPKPIQLFQVIK